MARNRAVTEQDDLPCWTHRRVQSVICCLLPCALCLHNWIRECTLIWRQRLFFKDSYRTCHRSGLSIECLQSVPRSTTGASTALFTPTRPERLLGTHFDMDLRLLGVLEAKCLLGWPSFSAWDSAHPAIKLMERKRDPGNMEGNVGCTAPSAINTIF